MLISFLSRIDGSVENVTSRREGSMILEGIRYFFPCTMYPRHVELMSFVVLVERESVQTGWREMYFLIYHNQDFILSSAER